MSGWGLVQSSQKLTTEGAVPASSELTTLNTTVANTLGNWVELVASTAVETVGVVVMINSPEEAADCLINIGIGSLSNEVIIAESLYIGQGEDHRMGTHYFLPLIIPRGSRISAQAQSTVTTKPPRVGIMLIAPLMGSARGFAKLEAIGDTAADSGGTQIDPGATIHTKGAYTQLTASTAVPYKGFLLAFGNQASNTRVSAYWLVDLAVGAAASEQVIAADMAISCDISTSSLFPVNTAFLPIEIPSGSRLAARAQCSSNDATDRLFDVIFYGVV
ncbi:MAG: hypothetical protein KAJ03_04435 [Gammaproteobacteria bacterium]|nr:hypothetical protein [Gammaproteobacteria bacterium]